MNLLIQLNDNQYICLRCGKPFSPKRKRYDKYCSRACAFADIGAWRRKDSAEMASCLACGTEFKKSYGFGNYKYCSTACHAAASARVQRAKHYGVPYKYFSERKILERDGWRCYLCGRDTPKELRGTYEDNAPELDHVIPLSRGGSHLPDNVRCSCRACNINKADRDRMEQLAIAFA